MKAKLWGKDGEKVNGWEPYVYTSYILAGIILVVGVGFKPDTSIKTWANNEARARKALKQSGLVTEFKFGTHYNDIDKKFSFQVDEIDEMPESNYEQKFQRFNTSLHNRKL
tara:strand:- start:316 stop:648 length:333 start_codon:yes stop_codon:yes gene_type:complete